LPGILVDRGQALKHAAHLAAQMRVQVRLGFFGKKNDTIRDLAEVLA